MRLHLYLTIIGLGSVISVCSRSFWGQMHLKKRFHRMESRSKIRNSMRLRRSLSTARLARFARSSDKLKYTRGGIDISFEKMYQEVVDEANATPSAQVDTLVSSKSNSLLQILLKEQEMDKYPNNVLRFPVDRSIHSLYIQYEGKCGPQIEIINPRQDHFNFTTRLYSRKGTTDRSENKRGLWTLVVNSGYQCNIKIFSESTMGFIMSLKTKVPDQDESAFKILKNLPIKHKSLAIILDGFGLEMLASGSKDQPNLVRFLDITGNDVIPAKNLSIEHTNGITSSAQVILNSGLQSDVPVYVVVEGHDYNGNKFSRMMKEPIRTSHVTLKNNVEDNVLPIGTEKTINITIKNNGLNVNGDVDYSVIALLDTFKINVEQTLRNFFSPSNVWKSITINSKETKMYPISFFVPIGEELGEPCQVTFKINGTRPGTFQFISFYVIAGRRISPQINSLVIKGTVNSRFAETVMTSSMSNTADIGLEAKFDVMLPVDAFITNLTMKLDNFTIIGKVEEKEKAKKIYKEAKKRGKATGNVEAQKSSTRLYKTSLFVEAGKNITFQLTYQQLLRKSRDGYKYAVVLNPNQLVKNLHVVVHIVEENPLNFIKIPFFDTGIAQSLFVGHPAGTSVSFGPGLKSSHIRYSPSIIQQSLLSPFGLSGTFAVEYDVIVPHVYGDITVANGYFFHFFTPPQRNIGLPKKVVFIIDKSGSMIGNKMKQVKDGLSTILRSLHEDDIFHVVYFNDRAKSFNKELVPAVVSNINKAINYLKSVEAGGGTRFIPAFQAAFKVINKHRSSNILENDTSILEENLITDVNHEDYSGSGSGWIEEELIDDGYENMIVFLTDGVGSDYKTAFPAIAKMNRGRMNIHTIAFGDDAEEKFLQKLAVLHNGTYRKIFDGLTASVQIQDFFDELTVTPFKNVSISYPVNRITDVTQIEFNPTNSDTEVVWGGKIRDDVDLLDVGEDFGSDTSLYPTNPPQLFTAQISGRYNDEMVEFDVPINPKSSSNIMTSHHQIKDFTERLWAFLYIKELQGKIVLTEPGFEKRQLKEKALNMSLKYNFVTPLTSMVVVLPEERKKIEEALKKQAEEEKQRLEKEKLKHLEEERKRIEQEQKRQEEERKRQEEERRRQEEERRRQEEERRRQEEERRRQEEEKRRQEEERLKLLQQANFQTTSMPLINSSSDVKTGGFRSDPHFFIPITSNINLCFNWDGKDKEIYNLLYEPSTGMTINAQLITTSAPDDSRRSHRTYVGALAFRFPIIDYKLIIRPKAITLFSPLLKEFIFPVTSSLTIRNSEIYLHVYDVTHNSSRVDLRVEDWEFHIFLHQNTRHYYQVDHLDFFLNTNEQHMISHLYGVIGQFINAEVSLVEEISVDEKIIKINEHLGKVRRFRGKQPGTQDSITCWYSHNNASDFTQASHDRYLVEKLTANPMFWV